MQVLGSLDSDCRPDNDLANLISFDERFDLVCGHNPNGWDFIRVSNLPFETHEHDKVIFWSWQPDLPVRPNLEVNRRLR
jgi:hypothetical protein